MRQRLTARCLILDRLRCSRIVPAVRAGVQPSQNLRQLITDDSYLSYGLISPAGLWFTSADVDGSGSATTPELANERRSLGFHYSRTSHPKSDLGHGLRDSLHSRVTAQRATAGPWLWRRMAEPGGCRARLAGDRN